jgi:hypothetical protein
MHRTFLKIIRNESTWEILVQMRDNIKMDLREIRHKDVTVFNWEKIWSHQTGWSRGNVLDLCFGGTLSQDTSCPK